MRQPSSYADGTRSVSVIETHFAWVFLTDHHAYKLKKAARRGALDYRTRAQRRRVCQQELRLNRRLAASVYLGLVTVRCRKDGALALGGSGRVVDYLVKMRRLPTTGMVDTALLRRRKLPQAAIKALAAHLARFYRRQSPRPLPPARYLATLRERIAGDARDLRAPDLKLSRTRVDAVVGLQRTALQRLAKLLGPRGARLIDGHGDLRPEHLSLGPPVAVIDCIEFSDTLRRLDPIDDLSLLALECTQLGERGTGSAMLTEYQKIANDPVTAPVLAFYMSCKATTRAKLAAWHLRDPMHRNRRHWVSKANRYLATAQRCALAALR